MSYQANIAKALGLLGKNGTANPDAKHNSGRLLGEAFLWDEVERYAKGRSEAAWKALQTEGIIKDKKELEPGDHELAYSPSFLATAKVTQPVKQFNPNELAKLLRESKYKVPESVTKELVDRAKLPSSSRATLKIIERG